MVQQGVITVNVPDEGHAGVLVQIELIPDLGEPAQDAATARLEAGANPSATPALKAPQPALIQRRNPGANERCHHRRQSGGPPPRHADPCGASGTSGAGCFGARSQTGAPASG